MYSCNSTAFGSNKLVRIFGFGERVFSHSMDEPMMVKRVLYGYLGNTSALIKYSTQDSRLSAGVLDCVATRR